MAQQNEQIARQSFEAWNAHDVNAFTKLLADDTVWESDAFPTAFRGQEGARQFFQVYVGAFPDLRFDLEQVLSDGDHVVVRWKSAGTQRGDLPGIPATNRTTSLHGCSVSEVKGGKIKRAWVYFDNASMMRQLGVLPG